MNKDLIYKEILDKIEKEDILRIPILHTIRQCIYQYPEQAFEIILDSCIWLSKEREKLLKEIIELKQNSIYPLNEEEE